VIVGDDEAAVREASLKPLRDERAQMRVPLDALADQLSQLLYGNDV
jgi:hypothetical protein